MTAIDRARFFAYDYPPPSRPVTVSSPPLRSRIPLRYRGYYGDRPFVYRSIFSRWTVCLPEGGSIHFTTFDEAIHEAHRLARVRAVRAIQDGAQ